MYVTTNVVLNNQIALAQLLHDRHTVAISTFT